MRRIKRLPNQEYLIDVLGRRTKSVADQDYFGYVKQTKEGYESELKEEIAEFFDFVLVSTNDLDPTLLKKN